MEKYIEVRIHQSGRITTHRSTKASYEMYDGDMYNSYNFVTQRSYEFFVTSNKRMRRDFKRHFKTMLKELDKEQAVIDKKRDHINKIISNSKEL